MNSMILIIHQRVVMDPATLLILGLGMVALKRRETRSDLSSVARRAMEDGDEPASEVKTIISCYEAK